MTIQYQGVWSLQSAAQLQSTQRWVTDPLFKNTTLLLQADDAANGAQNNTFLDSSSNSFAITRNGNTTQGTFTPFSQSPGRWSNYFDGSGDYLVTPSNSAFDPSGQNITVDFWVYLTRYATTVGAVFEVGSAAVGDMQCLIGNTGYVVFQIGGTNGSVVYGFTLNTWHYVTCVKSGTNFTVYLNGVAGTTVSMSPNSKTTLTIGAQGNGANVIDGYISNFRYVRGSATVPTSIPNAPLTNITNTSLLTCQSNRFVDNGTANSGSGFALTVNGNPSIQPFSPFAPQYQWTSSVIGGSGYFDGSGDFLSYATGGSAAFNLSTGDWTIEAWIYRNASGAGHQIINLFNSAGANSGLSFYVNSSNQLAQDNGVTATTAAGTVPANAWTHVAAVRSSGNTQLYVNGVAVGSAITQAPNTAQFFRIGITANDILPCNGYISGLRIIKGQALNSSGNFTPPTAPVTTTAVGWTGANVASSITGTVSLLTNFTNAAIYDGTMKNNLETVGNAQISTAVVKYGSGSMYFDGTGDILQIPKRPYFDFPGDFTIEFWLYVNSLASYSFLMDTRSSVSTFWLIDLTTAGVIGWGPDATIRISSSAITTGQWYHVAISRSGASTRMFLNGTQTGSTYTSSALITAGTTSVVIGGSTSNTFNANVYMDDIRITTGIARYTQNFIPPSVALPRQ